MMVSDGDASDLRYPLSHAFCLIVAALALAFLCQRNGDDAVYVAEEVCVSEFFGHGASEVDAYSRVVVVFEGFDDCCIARVGVIVHVSVCSDDRDFSPEQAFKWISCFGFVMREGKVHGACCANVAFAGCQSSFAHGAVLREERHPQIFQSEF